jgi:hypothetical protein
MITKFKLFEDVSIEEVYWRIEPKSEEYILASLKKIGVNIELYNNVKDKEIKFMIENNSPIYVARGYDKGSKSNWYFYTYGYQEFKNDHMKYIGILKLSKNEIKDFIIKSQAKKFNL